jgi:hypothetical protein
MRDVKGGLDARTPLLLLPVRIETRFVDDSQGSALLVRIYPDQIHCDAHDPALTPAELADAQGFWTLRWRAGLPPPDDAPLRDAWRNLVSTYRAPRAAWIVKALTPSNLAAQPAAPTAAGSDPVPPPAFPSPTMRTTAWNTPARATLLPDAWTVVLERAGTRTVQRGAAIISDLNVMLDPKGAGVAFPSGSTVDTGMQWMTDFDAAVAAGMAVRVPLDQSARSAGFDRIVVYGLRSDAGDASASLAALIDAHHYSDGMAFVPQGMPSNNTPDVDPVYKNVDTSGASYDAEFGAAVADPQSDGERLRAALGAPSASPTFTHLVDAAGHGARNGTDMLTALWPATLGYFLQQMMATTFSDAQIDAGRTWTLQNVVPRNPLAAVRAGNAPYGILPTTALQYYAPPELRQQLFGSLQPALIAFFKGLTAAWVGSIPDAPHIGAGDPDQDLLHVLGMDASSTTFDGRDVLGELFVTNWQVWNDMPDVVRMLWWQLHLALSRVAIDRYGSASWNPFVATANFDLGQFTIRYPTVCNEPLSETKLLADDAVAGTTKMNYIDWIRTASSDDLQYERYPGGTPPTSILYKLLRQAVLSEYAALAQRAEYGAGRLTAEQLIEPELVNIDAAHPTVTAWDVLARPSIDKPSLSWAEYLVQLVPPPGSPYERLTELRTSLQRLAALPTAELDRLLCETLDACSHRLDVWLTAIANALLAEARTANATGIHVGSYGWVENVQPAAARPAIAGSEREAANRLDALRARKTGVMKALPVPIVPTTDNGGFIHAPSYAQAATAAVLRAGYMSHQGTSSGPLLAIDLSSERVQRALWTLDGVRAGQQLSALLGYRFEAELEALGLQVYIQPFRDAYKIVGSELTPTDPAAEAVAASDVVDALALRAAWDSGALAAGGNWGPLLPAPGPDQNSVITLLKELDDIMDALSDLSMAEAVFQVMRGNFQRSGGLLDAVSKGAFAPEPQVIDSLRSGIDLTHRVMVLFAGTPAAAPGWNAIAAGARALAEPALDAWVGSLLPDPDRVRCTVSYTAPGGVVTYAAITLAQLAIGPLDFLALSETLQTPQRSELEERIRYAAALAPAIDDITIAFDRAGLPADTVTFPEALTVARTVRALVSAARALQPGDLCEPQVNAEAAGGSVNLAELQGRLATVTARLAADGAALTAAIAGLPAATDPVRAALVRAGEYGILGATPATSSGADPGLAPQAVAVSAELAKRSSAIAGMPNLTTADALAQFAVIFAKTIDVLPRLKAPNAATLQTAFGGSSALFAGADPHTVEAWVQQLTHVRPAIARLDAAYTCAQLLGVAGAPQFTFGQLAPLPAANGPDRWLGLPLNGTTPLSGRIALAAIGIGTITAGNDYAGLLVDEWPERIPSTKQTAAVAFHHEEPKSRPPQALLLAVCPDQRDTWDDELILATLEETLQLAKIRAVDLDSIIDVGQILPALYVPFNLEQAAVQTRFRLLATEVERFHA